MQISMLHTLYIHIYTLRREKPNNLVVNMELQIWEHKKSINDVFILCEFASYWYLIDPSMYLST